MNATTTNEPTIQLTPAAREQVQALLARAENAGKALRVYVEEGGCSGLQYGLVFDEQREGDLVSDLDGLPVVVDAFSLNYVRGSVVDFNDGLTGSGFKIANPNARQSCGCGKSFAT
jgi:iron-sulfur cluster assembly accessory protein